MNNQTNNNTYAQHGEDLMMLNYLIDNQYIINPVFVDIGAYDGYTMSNSRIFWEKYGWSLVLVDANSEAVKKAEELYKNDDKVTVHHEYITLEGRGYGYLPRQENWGLATVQVSGKKTKKYNKKTKTLLQFLKELKLTKKDDIGILSIDIEGQETEILKNVLNELKVRPLLICIEGNTKKEKEKARKLLKKEYDEIGELNVNLIFSRKDIKNYVP